jgi:tRNA modification GTPase
MPTASNELADAYPTNVIELTPRGRGAVAVVLVAGPAATAVVDRCFVSQRGKALAEIAMGRILVGRWGAADGEELVVCRRSDTEVEVHCHGGWAAVRALIGRLIQEGCREKTWQEWMEATAANPVRAAAQVALAQASTARAAAVLLDQFNGALNDTVCEVVSLVESGAWRQAADRLDVVLEFRSLGQHLTSPWQVVLAGRPNVGKSSLFNALAGYQRAIVTHLPGTTRDVVTITTSIDGWPVQLSDTAGLRDASDDLEAAGMALAEAALARSDLAIVVHDASAADLAAAGIADRLQEQPNALHVLNKIDLLPQADNRRLAGTDGTPLLRTSAVTGEGVAELLRAISESLVPKVPAAGAAVPFTASQVQYLEAARAAIDRRDAIAAAAALQALSKA